MARPVPVYMEVTPPPGKETDDSQTETVNEVKAWQREENTDFYGGVEVREDVREIDTIRKRGCKR